ncbi:MAG: DUF1013 domain-containing protein [Alphaproteobacteria bacterium]|nr:DUF1013 domain-containing protein [Alphaproteobacteria bacterium]
MVAPLMPKATAVWLIDNTSLTFRQIANFCEIHELEIQTIADGDIAVNIQGKSPVEVGLLSWEEIHRCEADASADLVANKLENDVREHNSKAKKILSPTQRAEKPSAILWILTNYPQVSDKEIRRLLQTTDTTIRKIRYGIASKDQAYADLKPKNAIHLGYFTEKELEAALQASVKKEKVKKAAPKKKAKKTAKKTTAKKATAMKTATKAAAKKTTAKKATAKKAATKKTATKAAAKKTTAKKATTKKTATKAAAKKTTAKKAAPKKTATKAAAKKTTAKKAAPKKTATKAAAKKTTAKKATAKKTATKAAAKKTTAKKTAPKKTATKAAAKKTTAKKAAPKKTAKKSSKK